VIITEVAASGEVELKNIGTSNANIGNYWFCNYPDYTVMVMANNLKDLDGITYNSKSEPGVVERVKYFVDAWGRTLYIFSRDSLYNNNFTAPDFSNNRTWTIFEETLKKTPSLVVVKLNIIAR
jgi:hypothetical protein